MEENMNKVNILFYLFIICCILSIAIFSPSMVSSYLQKSLDGKVSYVDVGVKTYEIKYYSIWEKIVSIKKCIEEEEGGLKTVPIATKVTESLKDTLTQQVVQQLKLLQKGIICDFFEIQKKHLIYCKKYAIYSSNKANGIHLWYLTYQNKEDTIQLIMDAEFNHIYRFELSLSEGGEDLRNQYFIQMEKKGVSAVYDNIYYSWTDNLSKYFTIDSDRFLYNTYPDMELLYKKCLFLYLDLYYETPKEEHTNTASYDTVYSDKSITDGNTISISCEYHWKEKGGLSLSWGFSFFNSMMQL